MEDSCLGPLTTNPVEYYRKKWIRIVDNTGFSFGRPSTLGPQPSYRQHVTFITPDVSTVQVESSAPPPS